jgi:hypothetical protein
LDFLGKIKDIVDTSVNNIKLPEPQIIHVETKTKKPQLPKHNEKQKEVSKQKYSPQIHQSNEVDFSILGL